MWLGRIVDSQFLMSKTTEMYQDGSCIYVSRIVLRFEVSAFIKDIKTLGKSLYSAYIPIGGTDIIVNCGDYSLEWK